MCSQGFKALKSWAGTKETQVSHSSTGSEPVFSQTYSILFIMDLLIFILSFFFNFLKF